MLTQMCEIVGRISMDQVLPLLAAIEHSCIITCACLCFQMTVRVCEGSDHMTPFTIYSNDFHSPNSVTALAAQLNTVPYEVN